MKIVNRKHDDANSKPESNKEIVGKCVSTASQVFVVSWVLADYYQKMANSHYDTAVQWCQMGLVFVVALFFSIHSFVKKRYFVGMLTIIITIWSFYWAFVVSFSCHA